MTILSIKEKETTITIEKTEETLNELFNSFISACIALGHDPEDIQQIFIETSNFFIQKK
jgi:DNA-binding transcriptional regulator YhcF (GntR family)